MATEIFDIRELAELILQGVTRSNAAGDGTGTSILVRDDGTIRVWSTSVGDSDDGETPFAVEPTGEQKVVLHGKDSDGNIDAFRTTKSQQLQVVVTSAMLMAQLVGIQDVLEKIVTQLSLITDVTL